MTPLLYRGYPQRCPSIQTLTLTRRSVPLLSPHYYYYYFHRGSDEATLNPMTPLLSRGFFHFHCCPTLTCNNSLRSALYAHPLNTGYLSLSYRGSDEATLNTMTPLLYRGTLPLFDLLFYFATSHSTPFRSPPTTILWFGIHVKP